MGDEIMGNNLKIIKKNNNIINKEVKKQKWFGCPKNPSIIIKKIQ